MRRYGSLININPSGEMEGRVARPSEKVYVCENGEEIDCERLIEYDNNSPGSE